MSQIKEQFELTCIEIQACANDLNALSQRMDDRDRAWAQKYLEELEQQEKANEQI